MTATYLLSRQLGWSYFERLARQKVLQSAADPPKKLLRQAFQGVMGCYIRARLPRR